MSHYRRASFRILSARISATFLAAVLGLGGSLSGRAAEPAAPAARRLPGDDGLVAYLEYDGFAAHRQSWEGTAAGAIVQRTSAGAMAAELSRQMLDQFLKNVPDTKVTGSEVLGAARDLLDGGFAVALYDRGDGNAYCVLVCRGFGRQDARQRLENLRRKLMPDAAGAKPIPAERIRGREVYRVATLLDGMNGHAEPGALPAGDEVPKAAVARARQEGGAQAKGNAQAAPAEAFQSFWFEGDDLFAVFSDSPDPAKVQPAAEAGKKPARPVSKHRDHLAAVFDAIEGKAKTVAAHEGYTLAIAEGADLNGFEGDGVLFFELGARSALLKALLSDATGDILEALSPGPRLTLPAGKYLHDDVQYIQGVPVLAPGSAPTPVPLETVSPVDPPDASGLQPPVPPTPPDSQRSLPAAPGPEPEVAPRAPREPGATEPGPAVVGGEQERPKVEALEEIAAVKLLGLNGINRFIVRWGFQGKGLVTIVRLDAPAPRRGALALIDQPAFRRDKLPPIPRGVTSFAVGSFDLLRSYDALIALAKQVEPEVGALVEAGEKAVRDATDLRLREDLLAHIGPTWCTFDVADRQRNASTGLSRGQVVVAQLRDPEAFVKVLDAAAARINRGLRELDGGAERERNLPALALERLPAPDRGYQLTSPAGLIVWLDDDLRPTVLVGKTSLIVAANPDVARAVRAAESAPGAAWQAAGELARSLAALPDDLTSLSVADAADSPWPDVIAKLPAYVQLLANLTQTFTAEGDAGPASALLAMAGVPRPAGFRVRLDASKLPKASAVRAHLFPSVLATTVDARGLRWVAREAFPLACVTGVLPAKLQYKIDLTQPAQSRLKLDFNVLGVKSK